MPTGFISYTHQADQDVAFASQLADYLRKTQFETWRDSDDLRAGDRWPRKLGDAIARFACVHTNLVVQREGVRFR